jgi:hypothetical protein
VSIIGYAAITNTRAGSVPGEAFTDAEDTRETEKSKKKYIDALAALVPAEVLAAHALVMTWATKTENKVVTITDAELLSFAFYALCIVSLILYAIPRYFGGRLDWWDGVRLFIPALAFVGWTMLQPMSAFDAVSSLAQPWRWTYAVILAMILGMAAGLLAYEIDKKAPGIKS